MCQVLIHVERVCVCSDPTKSDVGVLPLVCAALEIVFPDSAAVGIFPAEFIADIGRAWTPHEEEVREADQEETFDPVGHVVGGWGAVMHIEYTDGGHNGESDKHHGKHQVFTFEREKTRCHHKQINIVAAFNHTALSQSFVSHYSYG